MASTTRGSTQSSLGRRAQSSRELEEPPGVHAQILANRTFHLAFGSNRAMNGVAMNTFTIDANNHITAFASLEEAKAAKINHAEYFGSSQELAKLVASWPANRPVEVWNSFAGVAPFTKLKPVKRFTDRKVAVVRIWEAVQALLANVGKQAAHAAPAKGKPKKDAHKGKRRHTRARRREGSQHLSPAKVAKRPN